MDTHEPNGSGADEPPQYYIPSPPHYYTPGMRYEPDRPAQPSSSNPPIMKYIISPEAVPDGQKDPLELILEAERSSSNSPIIGPLWLPRTALGDAYEPNGSSARCPRIVQGFGFLKFAQHTEPQCFIDPGRYNTHDHYKIINEPDGLNSMLEAKHSPSNSLITNVPTVIIGMDVSHDCAPGDYDSPSIAAVVHSREWPHISEYRAYLQTQSPKAEMIDSLYKPMPGCDGKMRDSGIMRELLQDFYASSGNKKPEQIIIFRYGELELTQVLHEVDQIKEACKCFGDNWSPKFVVIKFFKHEAPENFPSRTIKNDKVFDDFRYYLHKCLAAGMIDTTMPRHYHVTLDEVGLSDNDLQDLVDSLAYVHQLRTHAFCSVAPCYFGLKRTHLDEPKTKRMKTKIEPDEINLERKREFIKGGEELALYVLGNLNKSETGDKYKLEQLLYDDYACKGFDPLNKKMWQHVSMFAKGDNASQKMIIFAELGYLDGEYVSISHSVLDPNDHAAIRYGCGFCFPSYAGPRISPHPADHSKYVAGHPPHIRSVI